MSSRVGRVQPSPSPQRFPICHWAAPLPELDALWQHAFNGGAVKGNQQLLIEPTPVQLSQEMQPLLSVLHWACGVGWPGQILRDLYSQEFKGGNPLHHDPVDVNGASSAACLLKCMISSFVLPVFRDFSAHLMVIFCTPYGYLLISSLYADSSPACMRPTTVMSSTNLIILFEGCVGFNRESIGSRW